MDNRKQSQVSPPPVGETAARISGGAPNSAHHTPHTTPAVMAKSAAKRKIPFILPTPFPCLESVFTAVCEAAGKIR